MFEGQTCCHHCLIAAFLYKCFSCSGSVIVVFCRWAGHVRLPQSRIRKEHAESTAIGNVHSCLYMLLHVRPGVRWPLWPHTVTCAPNALSKAISTPVIPKSLLTPLYTFTTCFTLISLPFPSLVLFSHVFYYLSQISQRAGSLFFLNIYLFFFFNFSNDFF